MTGLATALMAEIALITYRDLQAGGKAILPPPSDYVAVAIIFGVLALLPEGAKPLPGLIGWGFTVATFMNLWNPASPIGIAKAAANQQAAAAKPGYVAATNPSAPATTGA